MKAELYGPEDYWQATDEQRAEVCNDCGPAGWLNKYVSETFYGIGPDISEACNIHDWMYTFPSTAGLDYKDEADRVFLNNLLRFAEEAYDQELAEAETYWFPGFMKWRARRRHRARQDLAEIYYTAVSTFGGPSFWKGKNPEENLRTVDFEINPKDINKKEYREA